MQEEEEVVDGEAAEEPDMLNGGGCNLMQSVVFLTWICVAVSRRSLQLRALMSVFFPPRRRHAPGNPAFVCKPLPLLRFFFSFYLIGPAVTLGPSHTSDSGTLTGSDAVNVSVQLVPDVKDLRAFSPRRATRSACN